MRTSLFGSMLLGLGAMALALTTFAAPAAAQSALTGAVRSAEEGLMEGVLVSAKREGSKKIVTVVSNAGGVYSFPADRLEPGRYDISTRAVGYVLPGASSKMSVNVTANRDARLDLNLRRSNVLELSLQMTDPEWLMSYPLDDKTKFDLFRDCSRCHTMLRASMSTYNADQLAWVMKRMVYSAGSTPMTFQLPEGQTATWGRAEWGEPSALHRRQAEAVAAINLSSGMWNYELRTLPRPKGKETQVIYTTWELPAAMRPHDTRIGADGSIWFNHFNDNAIGKLNPKTGEVREWKWPYRAGQGSFAPTGARTLMGPDKQGRFYIGNQAQGGVVVFDPATEKFEFRNPPGGGEMIDVSGSHVDGFAWRAGNEGAYRIDVKTWEHTTLRGPRPTPAYDIAADKENNLFGAGRGSRYVWRVNPKTGEVSYWDIPEEPRGVGGFGSGMRRGITDAQNRLWWGGFDGNFVGLLDPRSPKGKEVTLHKVPFPWFFPYDAHYDELGYTWTGGIYADRVARLHVESGEWDFYLLPFQANIRDVNLQPAAAGKLSGLWIGHTHQGMITLVEPQAK